MKKQWLLLLGIILTIPVYSQNTQNTALDSLVNNEKNFSAMAREKNMRDAFLAFLSNECVLFKNGPTIGKKGWEEAKADRSWLWWEPDFADISTSGNFGITAGPSEYKPNRTDKGPIAYGDFVSVWIKQNGIWKLALDIGISHPKPAVRNVLHAISINPNDKTNKETKRTSQPNHIEKDFIASVSTIGSKAYLPILSSDARIYRKGNLPYINSSSIQNLLENQTAKFTFSITDGIESSSDDKCVFYGTVTLEKDGKSQQANFCHIWKKEDGNWKMLIEVIATW